MNLVCDSQIAHKFRSRSKQVRVVTEAWFGSQAYCLACKSDYLTTSKPNAIARDFVCSICCQSYELKSSERVEGKKVVDGAYTTMLERIRGLDAPVLVLLKYIRSLPNLPWMIDRLIAVHPVFLTDAVIEPRTPLSPNAKRAGWQGCSLRMDRIPPDGRLVIVSGGKIADPDQVRALYRASQPLKSISPDARGWTNMVLRMVRDINKPIFNLTDAYTRRELLEEAFPNSNRIDAKIRQQLQVLRDLGYIRFLSRGTYEVIDQIF